MCAELFDDNGKLMKDSYNQQVVVVFLGLAISRKPLSATAGGCFISDIQKCYFWRLLQAC